MRLFLSLRVPPIARSHLAAALAGASTTDVGQWHVTLAFLGEQPSEQPLLPGLRDVAAAAPPLALQLRGGGLFRRGGVLHADLAGDVAGLRRLAADVARVCADAGVGLEARPFRPHVTVARRARSAAPLHGYVGPRWTAEELEVVRSHLGAAARHEVLHRLRLTG